MLQISRDLEKSMTFKCNDYLLLNPFKTLHFSLSIGAEPRDVHHVGFATHEEADYCLCALFSRHVDAFCLKIRNLIVSTLACVNRKIRS